MNKTTAHEIIWWKGEYHMPLKKGGGNHLQFYDEADGQYDDEEERARINEEDKKALSLVHYFGLPFNELVFHFPTFGLHDDEYCGLFVQYAKGSIKRFEIDERKIDYLLSFNFGRDKSLFLTRLGYNANTARELCSDIYCNTDVQSLTFSGFRNNCLKCVAKTVLKGKLVTTVWELKKDFKLRLITLIPGGDKRWKQN